ncbi:MAG TPA: YbaN family protein [Bacteroidales bacterium]|nr:YbaN family protein [Bacteroidales bacterium]
MIKSIYIILGCLSVFLGVLGMIIPGLPTTPFLLLAAWFFLRSNNKLHKLLINNNILGNYIRKYENNKAISIRTKIYSIAIMWIMISLSTIFLIESNFIKVIVLIVGLIGTVVMGFVIKTFKE